MTILALGLSAFFSIFTTAVMSYISMATPIGPWIAPTLALLATLFTLFLPNAVRHRVVVLSVVSASIGGILATACGFSFPTLYFLHKELFESWLSNPLQFIAILSGISFLGGCVAFWLVDLVEHRFLDSPGYPFPIAQLVAQLLETGDKLKQSLQLLAGFASAVFFGIVNGNAFITITRAVSWRAVAIPAVGVDTSVIAMLLAIGYVTGHVIAIPLLVGMLARILMLDPLNMLLLPTLSNSEWTLAFCSGMILFGAFGDVFFVCRDWVKQVKKGALRGMGSIENRAAYSTQLKTFLWTQGVPLLGIIFLSYFFLRYFSFSFFTVIYLLLGALLCSYQIAIIAGKIGLAYLGRFATFVMMPALMFLPVGGMQAVLIATFVEVCGGVCVDLLVGRKIARIYAIDRNTVRLFQLFGLFVSSCAVGVVFLYLIRYCGLGTSQLFAYKAQARHLLINAKVFDFRVLVGGGLFGYLLKKVRINPGLVLGGLLMPINTSLGLIIGGFLAKSVQHQERGVPFWSGIFAGNSIWIVVKAFFG